MLLFLDNDIILKLSSIGILSEIEHLFSSPPSSIFILGTARHYIRNSSTLRKKYSKETIENALKAIETYNIIPDEYLDDSKFIELSQIDGIDSGEQILFSINIPDQDYLILTGDKRALRELSSHSKNISDSHREKIICLELLFIRLLKYIPFEDLAQKIKAANFCGDSVIKFCFIQDNLTIDKVIEGLNSYLFNLKSETGSLLHPE